MHPWNRALCTAACVCWPLAAACAESETPADAGDPLGALDGDASVFADISLAVSLGQHDIADPAGRVLVGAETRVIVNGGSGDGRVDGLHVEANGSELKEIGSAGTPVQYAFLYSPTDPQPGQSVTVLVRLRASRFTLSVAPLSVELNAPKPDQELDADAVLLVRWSGIDAPPDELWLNADRCPVEYEERERLDHQAQFEPRRTAQNHTLPCAVTLHTSWSQAEDIERSPFKALTLRRVTQRIRPFTLR